MKLSELKKVIKYVSIGEDDEVELKVRIDYRNSANASTATIHFHFPSLELEKADFTLTPIGEKNLISLELKGTALSYYKEK